MLKIIFLILSIHHFSFIYGGEIISANQLNDKTLIKILNSPDYEILNLKDKKIEKNVNVILYRVPVHGDCIPETHSVCSFEYYLAISEYDEQPAQAVYSLGTNGEIINIAWQGGAPANQGVLIWTIMKYPMEVIKKNKSLKQELAKYKVLVSVTSLTMEKI